MNERLEELEKKYKELGEEIERLKNGPELKKGDLCYVWNETQKPKIPYIRVYQGNNSFNYDGDECHTSDNYWNHYEKIEFQPNDISFTEAMNNPEKYEVRFKGSDSVRGEWKSILEIACNSINLVQGVSLEIRRKSDT